MGAAARFRLLQAREETDSAKREEHEAFAAFLDVPMEDVVAFDLLTETISAERIMADVDAVLVGGSGAFGVRDAAPWIPHFVSALGEIAETGFPMFCSCFGFQGLALALGADVQPDSDGAEVGTYAITVRAEGKSDPLFAHLPDTFMAQQGHKDRALELPRDSTWLASSEKCPYQAIRYKDHLVYATQFHPELDGAAQSSRFRNYFELYKGVYGEQRAREILEEICPSPEANGLLREFRRLLESR